MEPFEMKNEAFKTALKSFGKTEKSLLTDVDSLKKWMKTQPHLPEMLGDEHVKNFLLLNECNVEIAKKKIDLYYTIKTVIPDFYESINPKLSNMKEVMDLIYLTPLPTLTPEMDRLFFLKISNTAMVDMVQIKDILRMYTNIQEIRMKEDVMSGEILLCDLTGVTMELVKQLTIPFLYKIFYIIEHVYSFSLKAIYFLNAPQFYDIVMVFLQRVLKPKFFQRMHICRDLSLLYEVVPKEILPKDYGGQEKSLEELRGLLKIKFDEYHSRFDRLDALKPDENLRPGKLELDEVFELPGDFKQLDFD